MVVTENAKYGITVDPPAIGAFDKSKQKPVKETKPTPRSGVRQPPASKPSSLPGRNSPVSTSGSRSTARKSPTNPAGKRGSIGNKLTPLGAKTSTSTNSSGVRPKTVSQKAAGSEKSAAKSKCSISESKTTKSSSPALKEGEIKSSFGLGHN